MVTDGLKPVERRVLYSAFKLAKDKFVKSHLIDTHTCGHYHPHGETYGTVVTLVRQGLLIGQGNFGTKVGEQEEPPAAPRYTECKLSPKVYEMAFKYIKHVEWVQTELEDKEPLYLPTMFPICLMGNEYTQGIGFGYKTVIPCYSKKDLKKRLMWLLGKRVTEPVIKPKSDCKITSKPKELKQLLTTGKAKIEVEGIIEEIPHQNKVILRSWPPGRRFVAFLNKFSDELDSNMIGYTDLSSEETEIAFQVIRQRNRDAIYQDFIIKLKELLVGAVSFDMVLVNENHEVVDASVDMLLKKSYELYKDAVEKMLKAELKLTKDKKKDYQILLKIRPALKKYMARDLGVAMKIKRIAEDAKVLISDVERLMPLPIKKLLTMEVNIQELDQQISTINNNLENLDTYVLEQYESI
jgi:DNA gyrase/topoisomerase IV subunit A